MTASSRPLSPAQRRVLDRMREGWELGSMSTMDGRCWLQKGGIGMGGASETVSSATVSALLTRKLIRQHYRFPTSTYSLADETREEQGA